MFLWGRGGGGWGVTQVSRQAVGGDRVGDKGHLLGVSSRGGGGFGSRSQEAGGGKVAATHPVCPSPPSIPNPCSQSHP